MNGLCFLCLIFALGAYFWFNKKVIDKAYLVAVAIKLVVGIFFIWVYQNLYIGDLSEYIQLSEKWESRNFFEIIVNQNMDNQLIEQPRMLFFAKIFHFIRLASYTNIYVVGLFFSLVSSVLFFESYKLIKTHEDNLSVSFLIAMLVPTIVYWSSGVCKETLALPAFVYLVIFGLVFYKKKIEFKYLFFFCFTFVLVLMLRFFYLPFLFVFYFIVLSSKYYNNWRFWISGFGFLIVSYIIIQFSVPQLQFPILLELIYTNYHSFIEHSPEGGFLKIDYPNQELGSLLYALLQTRNALFFTDFRTIFSTIVSIENIFILVSILWAIAYNKNRDFKFWAILVLVIIASSFFVLVSPNFGSLVRYRVFYWFFMVWFVLSQIKKPFSGLSN